MSQSNKAMKTSTRSQAVGKVLSVTLLCGFLLRAAEPTPLLTMDEDQCLRLLQSPSASLEEKFDACRQLAVMGSERSIPVLAKLLEDPQLSDVARYALEPNPSPQVNAVLRQALQYLNGRQLIGVIHSIATRRDQEAVPQLITILRNHDDELVRHEAARALGSIGTEATAKALLDTLSAGSASPELRLAIAEGALRSAEQLALAGNVEIARMAFDRLRRLGARLPQQVRVAAWQGAILSRGTAGGQLFRQAILSNDRPVAAGALQLLRDITQPYVRNGTALQQELLSTLTETFNQLALPQQILAIKCLPNWPNSSLVKGLLQEALLKGNRELQLAAIAKLGELQPPWASPPLLALINANDAEIATAAEQVWIHLQDPSVDDALLLMLRSGVESTTERACRLVVERQLQAACPLLIELAQQGSKPIRIAAANAIGQLGTESHIEPLLHQLLQTKDQEEIQAYARALSRLVRESPQPGRLVSVLEASFRSADQQHKETILNLLATIGNDQALDLVRRIFQQDQDIRQAALRTLANWPTPSVIPYLWDIASNTDTPNHKYVTLTALLRWAQSPELPIDQRLAICRKITNYERDAALSRQLLAALGQIPHPEAVELILGFLQDQAVRQETLAAAQRCVDIVRKSNPPSEIKQQIVTKLANAAQNANLSDSERQLLSKLANSIK